MCLWILLYLSCYFPKESTGFLRKISPILQKSSSYFATAYVSPKQTSPRNNSLNMITHKCEDCIFYDPVKIDLFGREYIQGKCLKSGRTSMYEDLTQQNVTYEYAKICRRPNGFCGPEGAYFIPKNM